MARVDRTYVSSIDFLEQRDILKEVLDVTNEEVNILDIMDMAGRSEITDVVEYSHFENDYVFQSGVVTAIDGTKNGVGANTEIKCTVATKGELPVVGENVMFPNKKIGWVKEVDTAGKTFTARPITGEGFDDVAAVAVNDVAIYFSGAFGEGSGDPEGRQPNWIRSQNNIQIFKESASITDLQKVSKIEVNYNGKPHVMYKLQHDTLMRHRAKIAYAFLNGQKDKFTDADGNDVYQTQGLRQYIKNGDGSVNTTGGVEHTLATTIDKAQLRTVSRKLDKKGAPSEYWGWFGGDLMADTEDLFHGMDGLKNGGIVYNSFGKGDGKKKALDFGINSVYLYGRTIHFTKLKAYDHEELFGAEGATAANGYDFAESGYLIPTGKIKVDKSGTTKERILNRYMSGDGTNLKHMETLTGKLAPTPTNDVAQLSVGYESVCGFEAFGIKHFALLEP